MTAIAGARLSAGLLLLMATQPVMGLLLPGQYRDVDWIKATWVGNDWVTLLVGVPLLLAGIVLANQGSVRGLLLWLGVLGYAAYNYAFYLFGAALNAFFLLYVAAVVLAVINLIVALAHLDVAGLAHGFRQTTPVRMIGGALVLIGTGLAAVWIAMWAAYVFAGRPTPVEPEAFQVVAALDLVVMVPALVMGGILLWRRQPWGYAVATIASIQGALYLLVLSVNSVAAIRRGMVAAPGELPLWGTLMVFTAGIAAALLANAPAERASAQRRGIVAMPRRPATIRVLLTLLVFQAVSGLAGGFGLTMDPTGSAVGLDPEWLEGSPFGDYLIPGIILLLALGVGPLIVAMGVVRRLRWAWMASLLAGIALVIWITVQVLIIGYISQPPLQVVYGLIGLGIIATSLLPSVRRHLPAKT